LRHSSFRQVWRAALTALVCWLLAGCRKPQNEQLPSESAPSSSQLLSSAASAPVPEAPPFSGSWIGRYTAKQHKVEVQNEHARENAWQQDDGQSNSGKGTIELTLDAQGGISGKLSGPLGAMIASGELQEGRLAAQLTPQAETPNALAGVLTGRLAEGVIRGSIQASSADSLVVRSATFELKKSGAP